MQPFRYERPASLEGAVELLAEHGPAARILAGGTDLIIRLRDGTLRPDLVVDVKRIPDLAAQIAERDGRLSISAGTTMTDIAADPRIRRHFRALAEAATVVGSVQIRNRATLAGNICNASPAADSIPALIAHSAICEIALPQTRRRVPVEEFCVAPGKTVLGKGEFLVSLHLPPPPPRFGAAYLRFTPRNEMDIAVVGVGAAVQLDESQRRIVAARIALGAVAPTPLFVPEAGEALIGAEVGEKAFARAATIAQSAARPITDLRGTAEFRRHLVGVLTRRALAKAVERATQATE